MGQFDFKVTTNCNFQPTGLVPPIPDVNDYQIGIAFPHVDICGHLHNRVNRQFPVFASSDWVKDSSTVLTISRR